MGVPGPSNCGSASRQKHSLKTASEVYIVEKISCLIENKKLIDAAEYERSIIVLKYENIKYKHYHTGYATMNIKIKCGLLQWLSVVKR